MFLSSTTVLVPSRDEIDNHGQADLPNLNQEAPWQELPLFMMSRVNTDTPAL